MRALCAAGLCGWRLGVGGRQAGGAAHPPVSQAAGAAACWAVGTQLEHLFQETIKHPRVCLLQQGLASKDALGSKVWRRQASQGLSDLKPCVRTTLRPTGALQLARPRRVGLAQLAPWEQLGPHGPLVL